MDDKIEGILRGQHYQKLRRIRICREQFSLTFRRKTQIERSVFLIYNFLWRIICFLLLLRLIRVSFSFSSFGYLFYFLFPFFIFYSTLFSILHCLISIGQYSFPASVKPYNDNHFLRAIRLFYVIPSHFNIADANSELTRSMKIEGAGEVCIWAHFLINTWLKCVDFRWWREMLIWQKSVILLKRERVRRRKYIKDKVWKCYLQKE